MTIEEFWNRAFLSALARLPAEDALKEATKATGLCIEHWNMARNHRVCPTVSLWKDQQIDGTNTRPHYTATHGHGNSAG